MSYRAIDFESLQELFCHQDLKSSQYFCIQSVCETILDIQLFFSDPCLEINVTKENREFMESSEVCYDLFFYSINSILTK